MNIFGNCTCPACALETRFLFEHGEEEAFFLLGDLLSSNETIHGEVECDYCQHPFSLHGVLVENVLSGFLNDTEYEQYQNGMYVVAKANQHAGLEKEQNQELQQFHETFAVPFETQPYARGHVLTIGKHQWTVQSAYKKEGTETEITKRLLTPTLDEYWYAVENELGQKKWCIVTDTNYERLFEPETKEVRTFASELQRVERVDQWYEFHVEDEVDSEEEKEEHNAILTIEPPFLKENEQKFDVSDSLFQTTLLFDRNITDNLSIKAYHYLSGVRFFVVNKEGELELDLFGESTESLLDLVQEQLSISVDE